MPTFSLFATEPDDECPTNQERNNNNNNNVASNKANNTTGQQQDDDLFFHAFHSSCGPSWNDSIADFAQEAQRFFASSEAKRMFGLPQQQLQQPPVFSFFQPKITTIHNEDITSHSNNLDDDEISFHIRRQILLEENENEKKEIVGESGSSESNRIDGKNKRSNCRDTSAFGTVDENAIVRPFTSSSSPASFLKNLESTPVTTTTVEKNTDEESFSDDDTKKNSGK